MTPADESPFPPFQGNVPPDAHVFMISVAAQLSGMHAQTLRTYDKMGLVSPKRTEGGDRRYSSRDVQLLCQVQELSQKHGVNLAGIKQIISLTKKVSDLEERLAAKEEELRQVYQQIRSMRSSVRETSSAVVVWQPRQGRRRP